jgi:polyhydroxybutyrate depolymerase
MPISEQRAAVTPSSVNRNPLFLFPAIVLGCALESPTPPPEGTAGVGGGVPAGGAGGHSSGAPGKSGTGGLGTGGTMGGAPAAGRGGTAGGSGSTGLGGRGGSAAEGGMAGGGPLAGAGGAAGGIAGAATGGNAGVGGVAGMATSGAGGSGGAARSDGCGKAPPASERYTIDVDGSMREYILAVPDDYDPERAYPIVFAWHPLGGSAQQVAGSGNSGYYGLRAQADGGAIFVSPEGLEFNGGSLGWANTGGRDIAFLEAMLERFRGELCVDEGRIFSTGFSFGGMMSFAVGCAMGGVVRAIAPMAGNIQVSGCEDGDGAVAIMGFHGLDDTVVSIDGGRDGRDVFIERNGCTEQTMPAPPAYCDGVSDNYQPCSCVSYQGCTAGYPVVWCEFTGPHTPAPSSAATIWSFFSQF